MKIYLAPMEGITTYIFRNAFEKYYGGVDKYFTPFLTASHLKGREKRDVLPDNNRVSQLVPQILTNDSELFIKIALQLEELGYKEVNLNLGCPSGTVTGKGRGAGFLDRTVELDRFLYEIYERLDMNISIKTRIGMEFLSEWDDILEIYKKYPVSELIIHPRLRNEFYGGAVHTESFMQAFKVFSNDTEICYNGDITDITSYESIRDIVQPEYEKRHQEELFMIGRGAIMNPLLPAQIKQVSSDTSTHEVSELTGIRSDVETFRSFINEIMEEYIDEMSNEKQVVMKMKELWSYFAIGTKLDRRLLKEIHKVNRLSDYKSAVQMVISQIR